MLFKLLMEKAQFRLLLAAAENVLCCNYVWLLLEKSGGLLPMGREWSAEVEMEGEVLQVYVQLLVVPQAHSSLDR